MKKLLLFTLFLVFLGTGTLSAQDIIRDDVVFKSGSHVLSGTLAAPEGRRNLPVLIFMGGVNEYGSFHGNRETFIEENLISIFPERGVAVFFYDPRGTGSSSGKWQRTSLSDFADDAKAAIDFLTDRKEIDPERIGLIGHGEHGWVAQIAAARYPEDIKLMISLAGPPFDAQTQLVNEYHNDYVCDGQDSTGAYDKAERKAQSHVNWVSIFPLTKRWRHMKLKQDFNPAAYLRDIEVPSLFLFGENDGEVYPSWAMDGFRATFNNDLPGNFTVQTIPGANHYFKIADRCYKNGNDTIEKNYSFRFKEVFRNWVFDHL